MKTFETIIEELKKEAENFKRITDKRLEEANELVEGVIGAIREAGLNGKSDIKLFDNDELGLGFRYRGANNLGYWLYLERLDTGNALPSCTNDLNRETYLAGNFNAYISYMDTQETLDTLKKLPDYIKFVKEKLQELTKEFEGENEQGTV